VMFLINAIYFKGSWRDRFDPAKTRDGDFTTIAGTTQTVKLMSRGKGEGKLRHGFVNGVTVGELSYGNGAFVMTVLVPEMHGNGGNVNEVAATLDTAAWRGFVAPMQEIEGEVILPRFTMEYERELADDLKALGMPVAFDDVAADFSGLSPAGADMYIAFVKHKTFVKVDEEGTEAAAVTNTGIGVTSLPPGLRVTRPFIFAIRERFSGTILFMGKIVRIPG
jgi:serine protease inhibitor